MLLFIVVGAQFYCGMSSVTANSRMIYAFSRDGAVPGSQFWHKINPRTRTPTNSIWFAAVGAFILGLPYLWNPVAYSAVTSIAVIGLYIAYGIPILLRLLAGSGSSAAPGTSGGGAPIVGWIAVIWIAFIAILFVLPQAAPGNTLDHLQLRPGRGRRSVALLGGLLVPLRQELVQGTEGSRDCRKSLPRSKPNSPPSGSQTSAETDRPKIGITVHPRRGLEYYVPYRRAVIAAGAEPVDLVPGTKALPDLDGLLLPGGWDVDPSFYGERRDEKVGETDPELDETELALFRQAREREIPVLGICRGQQVINVAMGGSLVQHLEGHEVRALGRSHLAHTIEVDPSSELGRAAGEHKVRVNSLHHQAIKKLAEGLQQTARGEDGTVEGVESDDGLIVAVQCHPEELTTDLPWARNLFERFVARARVRRQKK